jgi:thymidine kinase
MERISENLESTNNKKAYLELITGPMYSGKTTKILEIYKHYHFCSKSVAVINHSADTRYHESMLSSHDKVMIPCIQTEKISDVWFYTNLDEEFNALLGEHHIKLRNADVILINEAQFFGDLYVCVIDMLNEKKKVFVSGLDGDFERKKFGQILDLYPLCDKVTKLSALCGLCKNGEPGIFSLRLNKETSQILIGNDNYIPVCRECYEKQKNTDTDTDR